MDQPVDRSPVDHLIDSFDVPDRWLRIFHAAARERSFTAAGRVVGTGQPAVSHAIRQLERRLRTRLFDRTASPIELTTSGRTLFDEIAPALLMIDRAVSRCRGSERTVTISVSTSFATWWLLPRLTRFKAEHPDIEFRCITSDNDDRVGRDHADLWIPHGPGPWPGFDSDRLALERVMAVVAPALAAQITEPDDPNSIAEVPIIRLEETYAPRFDWHRWCAAQRVDPPTASTITSNDYALVVQAALDGQGVALGWQHIVAPLIEDGRLVPLGGAPIETDVPFVILRRRGTHSDALDSVRSWLAATAD